MTLAIRTYAPLTSQAAAEVVRIFGAAGIDVLWRDCASDPCRDLDGVSVRFADAGTRSPGDELGYAMVLDGRGVLATIYTDRVTAVARSGLVPHPVLLGRAIAHEVGHLLGLPHGRGIMRARFNAASLRLERRGTSWLFATHEAKAMRQALQREPVVVARSLDSRQH